MTETEKTLAAQKRLYSFLFMVLRPIAALIFPFKVYGRENVPEGPVLICAPHSHLLDPVFISLAMGRKVFVRHVAKAELMPFPLVGWIMRKVGSIFIRRGESDIEAFKQCLRALKAGEKIMIFPEGTRVKEDNAVEPKSGAVRIAAKLRVPILPVYLPRDKKAFRRFDIVFGEPYMVDNARGADYEELSRDLMKRALALKRS